MERLSKIEEQLFKIGESFFEICDLLCIVSKGLAECEKAGHLKSRNGYLSNGAVI